MEITDLPHSFTRAQAVALGLTDRQLRAAVDGGLVDRLARGRFRAALELHRFEDRRRGHLSDCESALLQHPGGFVLSHLSAAMAHGLQVPLVPLDEVHLTVDGAAHTCHRTGFVAIHHGASVRVTSTMASGMPCTPIVRTLADCLREHPPAVAVPLVDDALRHGFCVIEDIDRQLSAQVHWPDKTRARRSLLLVDGRRESWLESRAAVALSASAVDPPVPQATVYSAQGRFLGRVDGIWEADNTVLEVDGEEKYLLPDADGVVDPDARRRAQEIREHGLRSAGLAMVRLDSDAVHGDDEVLFRRVNAARWAGRIGIGFRGSIEIPPATGLRLPR